MNVGYGPNFQGAAPAVTRVVDSFNRATLNPVGLNTWMHVPFTIIPIANPLISGFAQCPNTGRILLSAQANGGGGAGTYQSTILPCTGLTFSALNGKAQYCQSTFRGFVSGSFTACGNMVMGSWDGISSGQWYGIVHRNGGLTAVEKASVTGDVLGNTILFTDIAPVAGDVWRLSFDPSSNTLTATKNGVVVYSAVDNVSPLTAGIPGYNLRSIGQAAGVTSGVLCSDLDCGLGL